MVEEQNISFSNNGYTAYQKYFASHEWLQGSALCSKRTQLQIQDKVYNTE